MAALADYAAYCAALLAPRTRRCESHAASATAAGAGFQSMWQPVNASGLSIGAVITTAAAPTAATAGAWIPEATDASQLWLAECAANCDVAGAGSMNQGCLMIFDRLSHQGGLSGTGAGAQTTNLPTAALTRYTNGVGVQAWLEVYSTIGATGTTFTASYTNQAGTTGQVAIASAIGAAGHREAGAMMPFNLVAGDTGVKAVASVTLAATTGTVGAFGVTLLKPLALIPVGNSPGQPLLWNGLFGGNLTEVITNACISGAINNVGTQTSSPILQSDITLIRS